MELSETARTLFTLLGGAVITAAFTLLGAWIASRREHKKWIRQERLKAYFGFLEITERLPYNIISELDQAMTYREFTEGFPAALAAIQLVGPDSVREAGQNLLGAVASSDLPAATKEQNEKTEEARKIFVRAARKVVKFDS